MGTGRGDVIWLPLSMPGAILVLGLAVAVLSIVLDINVRRHIVAGEEQLPQRS